MPVLPLVALLVLVALDLRKHDGMPLSERYQQLRVKGDP